MSKNLIRLLCIVLIASGIAFLYLNPVTQVEAPPAGTHIIPQDTAAKPDIHYTNASSDLIVVELPFPGAVTGKEFSVIGKARGTWFFEASFPIELVDAAGKQIAQGIAQAQGEWMTEDFVPFRADIKVPESFIGPATLILRKDNPSGLSEHDASLSFSIVVEY